MLVQIPDIYYVFRHKNDKFPHIESMTMPLVNYTYQGQACRMSCVSCNLCGLWIFQY